MKVPALENEDTRRGAGLLVLRLVVGATFLVHGLDKLIDLGSAERNFASLGIPAPALMGPFVAITEIVGGGLLVVGLTTRLVGLALAGDMLVAFLTAHIGNGFFVNEGGGEFVLMLGGASLALVLTWAGRFSIDEAFDITPSLWSRALRTRGAIPQPGQVKGTS